MRTQNIILAALLAAGATACTTMTSAPTVSARMHLVSIDGQGAELGVITVRNTRAGVALDVALQGLPPGDHGMHVHAGGSCDSSVNDSGAVVVAGAAQGHYDPAQTARHGGPMGSGHMGDLPLLHVDARGDAHVSLMAPHITSAESLRGHAIVIHAGGDNYSDTPAPLGGGGARIACGVIG